MLPGDHLDGFPSTMVSSACTELHQKDALSFLLACHNQHSCKCYQHDLPECHHRLDAVPKLHCMQTHVRSGMLEHDSHAFIRDILKVADIYTVMRVHFMLWLSCRIMQQQVPEVLDHSLSVWGVDPASHRVVLTEVNETQA